MTDTVENLILDVVEWVGRKERTYHETIDAWRTSCSRLPVWEDATDRGLVKTVSANGRSLVRRNGSGSRSPEGEETRLLRATTSTIFRDSSDDGACDLTRRSSEPALCVLIL